MSSSLSVMSKRLVSLGLLRQAGAESFNAVETFGDVLHRTGVAQSHMSVGTERDTGDAGDFLLVEKFIAEVSAAETEARNVREYIERAQWFDTGDAGNLSEPVVHVFATAVKRFDHFADETLVAFQAGERAFLGEAGRIRGRVRLNGINRDGDADRCGDIPAAPAGHRLGFAESVDGDGEIVDFLAQAGETCGNRAIIGNFLVDFVGEHEDFFFNGDFGERE